MRCSKWSCRDVIGRLLEAKPFYNYVVAALLSLNDSALSFFRKSYSDIGWRNMAINWEKKCFFCIFSMRPI